MSRLTVDAVRSQPPSFSVRPETHDHSDRSCLIWMGEYMDLCNLHQLSPGLYYPISAADHVAISLELL